MSTLVALPERPRPREPVEPQAAPAYAELMTTSNFSFLRAGSHPEELVSAAAAMGLAGIGIADRNSFAGVVRGYVALRDMENRPHGFRYVVGVRLVFADDTPDIIAYPSDREAYGRLCRMLTRGNRVGEKGDCRLCLDDLIEFIEGQLLIVSPDETRLDHTADLLRRLEALSPGNVWLAAAPRFRGSDRARLNRLAELARDTGTRMLAVNDALYHDPARRIVQDVVTCIREHLTLETAGRRLEQNAERHLKPPGEMLRLFAEHKAAIRETTRLLRRIDFSLDQLKYNYPTETTGNGETAQETLERLTWAGAHNRYPGGIPEKVKVAIWSELCLIAFKAYAPYFLTVEDVVRYARNDLKILCQGRGSAANSAVCFCLGITSVDPATINLVFGRFLSTEREEPPDIDVDFEHERREEVMKYVYAKYGGKRTGLTANVISYRSKSAIRETAKVFGLSDDVIAAINQMHWGWGSSANQSGVAELGFNRDDPTLTQLFDVVSVLKSFPRHLSQHVGGFVITRDSLESLVPISKSAMESRTIIEWNKDDIDALGILKVDILALGMLTCLAKAFKLVRQRYGREVDLDILMAEEHQPEKKARVYAMAQRADTVGVFQIESRAQMTMLPRLKPKEFYDLVIEVAIVRPGPIQGGMVHPYLKRRDGTEAWKEDVRGELSQVLERTLGIPLFQEQAMQIAVVGAGFSAGEADQLRRAMAAWRRTGKIEKFERRFLAGMQQNGYPLDYAQRCFNQIKGFAEYGFPESHAASFALLVYASCWLKCHYPDVFAAALLNSQPMGFYAPAQLVRDAIEHGVEIREVDINASDYDHTLETGSAGSEHIWPRHRSMADDIWSTHAVRLGLSRVSGLKKVDAERIVAVRGERYTSVRDLWLRSGLAPAVLEKLAEADAFGSLGLSRREALWAVRGLIGSHGAETLPLFASSGLPTSEENESTDLPIMPAGEAVVHDYRSIALSLKAHPVSFLRDRLDRQRVLPCAKLVDMPNGAMVEAAGLVLVRQQPATASGVIFSTLEDETGIANIVIWNRAFQANRKVILGSRLMAVRGKLQREGLVTHIVAERFTDMTPDLLALAAGLEFGDKALARADEGRMGTDDPRQEAQRRREENARRQARAALPSGRNFH